MLKKYHGIIPPIITPVDTRENVDESGYRQLLEYCVQGGLHGILVAGTNGETMALTQKERTRAIRITLEQINGRIPVMAGCMDPSPRRVWSASSTPRPSASSRTSRRRRTWV